MSSVFSQPFVPGLARAEEADHLIVPWAACDSPQWWPALLSVAPQHSTNLRALLQGLRIGELDRAPASSLSPPHERALARALGWPELPDGQLPWAALGQGRADQACGWVSLCHWAMGREQATLSDPQHLQIRPQESAALLEAMRPFFESEGIELTALTPDRWLACGQALELPCAALERVIGRDVDPWLPAGVQGRLLRRLQNEMQMLLYTHPVNEARSARGEAAINSLWFSGTGRLPPAVGAAAAVHMPQTLTQAALANDWDAYAQGWGQLDRLAFKPLLERQRSGRPVTLTLCGEQGALSLHSAQPTLWQRLKARLAAPRWPNLLKDSL
jgi:hypothetical protein